jgi:hypothetical protein
LTFWAHYFSGLVVHPTWPNDVTPIWTVAFIRRRSNSTAYNRTDNHNVDTSCRSTSFHCDDVGGPVVRVGVSTAVVAVLELSQLRSKIAEASDLLIDLRETLLNEGLGVSARASSTVSDVEQFLDVGEAKTYSLGVLDEPESFLGSSVVDAIARRTPTQG